MNEEPNHLAGGNAGFGDLIAFGLTRDSHQSLLGQPTCQMLPNPVGAEDTMGKTSPKKNPSPHLADPLLDVVEHDCYL